MSSLIFYTEENQVLVATDTLATSSEGKPFMFTTKTLIVPHLRMIACATGAGGNLLISNLQNVRNFVTPEQLQ